MFLPQLQISPFCLLHLFSLIYLQIDLVGQILKNFVCCPPNTILYDIFENLESSNFLNKLDIISQFLLDGNIRVSRLLLTSCC